MFLDYIGSATRLHITGFMQWCVRNFCTTRNVTKFYAICAITPVFSSKVDLKDAIDACLQEFPKGDCSNGQYGPIAEWDVSGVTDMGSAFADAKYFDSDISKWDISSVTDLTFMFMYATAFNSDLSKWDVSSVTDMCGVFGGANSFNGDISKWDVSGVIEMSFMFNDAKSFNRDLSQWNLSLIHI